MSHAIFVKPGQSVRLDRIPTDADGGMSKTNGREAAALLGKELSELQELMFAAAETPVLVVLQGRDTSGKDGTIKALLEHINVHSCRVASFKVPTPEELSHDFLWRVHKHAPPKGGMTIFNRSHYEDVLAVRVHNLAPAGIWRKRFDHINDFERLLHESGTIVLKFFLHISKEEQKERLLAREEDPVKAWKLSVGDWKERELWDDYTRAFEDVLKRCSTPYAPWAVIPADRKWFRDLAVIEAIVEALRPFRKRWMRQLEEMGKAEKAALAEYRAQEGAEAV